MLRDQMKDGDWRFPDLHDPSEGVSLKRTTSHQTSAALRHNDLLALDGTP